MIAYCDMTNDEARWAMGVLERDRVIERDGETHGAILWRLVQERS
jgi:hypothetical protein